MLKHNMQSLLHKPQHVLVHWHTIFRGEHFYNWKHIRPDVKMFIKKHYYLNHHILTKYVEVCIVKVVGALEIIVH
jgi:hypothetical protein